MGTKRYIAIIIPLLLLVTSTVGVLIGVISGKIGNHEPWRLIFAITGTAILISFASIVIYRLYIKNKSL